MGRWRGGGGDRGKGWRWKDKGLKQSWKAAGFLTPVETVVTPPPSPSALLLGPSSLFFWMVRRCFQSGLFITGNAMVMVANNAAGWDISI